MANTNPYHRAMITYSVPLRLDLMAQLVLPVQLTEEDGDRLCALIRSLQFPAAAIETLKTEGFAEEVGPVAAEADKERP